MSDTVNPPAEEVAAETKTAAVEPAPAEAVPTNEDQTKGAGDQTTTTTTDDQVKADSQPAAVAPSDEAGPEKSTEPTPAEESADKKSEEVSTNQDNSKADDMMAEPIVNEATKATADEDNSEVKMDTSTSEEKTAEEKADVTNSSPADVAPITSEITQTPNVQATENKEPVSDVKPTTQDTNQQPKSQQEQMPTRQYLNATVVPILHSALSQLAKTRPDDPIQFLGQYLLQYKETFTQEQK